MTEMVAGVDLVQAQLRLARVLRWRRPWAGPARTRPGSGGTRSRPGSWPKTPQRMAPSTGTLGLVREPGGLGVRVDSACEPGQAVSVHYDPLLAKLICWGRSREEALARLRRALDEYVLTGVRSSLPFHRWLVRQPDFLAGDVSTAYIGERWEPVATSMGTRRRGQGGDAGGRPDPGSGPGGSLRRGGTGASRRRRGARPQRGSGARWRIVARKRRPGEATGHPGREGRPGGPAGTSPRCSAPGRRGPRAGRGASPGARSLQRPAGWALVRGAPRSGQRPGGAGKGWSAWTAGRLYRWWTSAPPSQRGGAGAGAGSGSRGAVTVAAPMPGRVVAVPVNPGIRCSGADGGRSGGDEDGEAPSPPRTPGRWWRCWSAPGKRCNSARRWCGSTRAGRAAHGAGPDQGDVGQDHQGALRQGWVA